MLVAHAGAGAGSPLTMVQVRQLGGALARREPGQGAAGPIGAPYLVYGLGVTPTPQAGAAVRAALDALIAALAPAGTGRRPLNFTERGDDPRAAFAPEDWRRLVALKALRDPTA